VDQENDKEPELAAVNQPVIPSIKTYAGAVNRNNFCVANTHFNSNLLT